MPANHIGTMSNDAKATGKSNQLKSRTQLPAGDKQQVAIFITNVFGSLTFLFFCLLFFGLWITWNLGIITQRKPFDPYPFPGLEMIVSLFAIILSVSVLSSQKRQSRQLKIDQQVEFEVNVRAENEITQVLRMLHEIQSKLGISQSDDQLEEMKKDLDLHEIHEQLNSDETR